MACTHVHSHTTDTWPAVTLDLVLVVGSASLQQGLVDTTTTCNDTDHGTAVGRQDLL